VGRPKEHDAQTATALLEAAERAIQERGIDGLSVRGVAADVGTSTRAVYSLFGSKEGLVAALGTRAFDVLGTAVARLPRTNDPAADLVRAGLAFRRFAIEHPSLFAIGVQRTERLPDQSWNAPNAARIAALVVLEDRLARLRSARPLGERTVRSMATHFHAYCEGMAANEIRCGVPRDDAAMERLWVDGLTAILHGLQTSTTSDVTLAASAGDTYL
jgi:AcrR family transcriptional regulator